MHNAEHGGLTMTGKPAVAQAQLAANGARGPSMTLRDVAAYIGMSRRWVAERVRRREIPCYRFGTALRFDHEEVRRWTERYWSAPEGRGRDPERVRR